MRDMLLFIVTSVLVFIIAQGDPEKTELMLENSFLKEEIKRIKEHCQKEHWELPRGQVIRKDQAQWKF